MLGGAGAGKTTLAKALAKRRRMAFFDMDTLLRPAAEVIMAVSGLDPNDRDSSDYKTLCRDLGYRLTMDAALENVELGTDVIVIGPFTKETEDPIWIENELSRIGASLQDVEVKAAFIFLQYDVDYRSRIEERHLIHDKWKLDNWEVFRQSLTLRELKWRLPASSVLYLDNSKPLTGDTISLFERFVYGTEAGL
ncbi:Shikimate kinase [compost metagenome]